MFEIPIEVIEPMILAVLKHPQKKLKVKRFMIKIFHAIRAAYPGDLDFK